MNYKILEKIEDKVFPFSTKDVIDDVFCCSCIRDTNSPLVITFSNAKEVTYQNDLTRYDYSPWAFDFLISNNFNVISFSSINKENWYRSEIFHDFIESLSPLLKVFPERIGYGGSMGGYAASAFSNVLGLERLVLYNPISSLHEKLTPWETRFLFAKRELNWDSRYNDGAVSHSKGFIIYDPLFKLDRLHAKRYKLKGIRIYGVGHGVPRHLANLGLLKKTALECLKGDFNEVEFYKRSRRRRDYQGYYNWLLSEENARLTLPRKKIIKSHKKSYLKKTGEKDLLSLNFLILKFLMKIKNKILKVRFVKNIS
ncbi:hypothetical protein AB6C79_09745 [Vibrio splendidus]